MVIQKVLEMKTEGKTALRRVAGLDPTEPAILVQNVGGRG